MWSEFEWENKVSCTCLLELMLLPSRDQPLLNVCATGRHKHHDQGCSRIPGPHHARDQHVLSHAEDSSSGPLALSAVDGGVCQLMAACAS
jgi:hypothetical protein